MDTLGSPMTSDKNLSLQASTPNRLHEASRFFNTCLIAADQPSGKEASTTLTDWPRRCVWVACCAVSAIFTKVKDTTSSKHKHSRH